MGWPKLPRMLLTDDVFIRRNVWGTDLDGGRTVIGSEVVGPYFAAVQPGQPELEQDPGEDGPGRVTTKVPFVVDFDQTVAINAHDVILWLDPRTGQQHNIVVESLVNLGGDCGTFQATGVERT